MKKTDNDWPERMEFIYMNSALPPAKREMSPFVAHFFR